MRNRIPQNEQNASAGNAGAAVTPQTAKAVELPTEGGSYHRLPDGSLERRNQTPKDDAEAQAQLQRDAEVKALHAQAISAAAPQPAAEAAPESAQG